MKVDFKNNGEVLTNLIKKLVLRKFPKIVEIEDIEHMASSFRGDTYFVHLVTSECLDMEEQVEIDSVVKELFKMASLDSASQSDFKIGSDKIMVFFDCGDGEGFTFKAPFGYNH